MRKPKQEHPHATLRHLMDAALDHARKYSVAYQLKLKFPDGFRFEERWAPKKPGAAP